MNVVEKVNQILKQANISKVNLAKYLGVKREEIMTFGDAENDLDSLSEKCDKVIKAGETYESFGGISDDMKGSVKFIIKTDSISK